MNPGYCERILRLCELPSHSGLFKELATHNPPISLLPLSMQYNKVENEQHIHKYTYMLSNSILPLPLYYVRIYVRMYTPLPSTSPSSSSLSLSLSLLLPLPSPRCPPEARCSLCLQTALVLRKAGCHKTSSAAHPSCNSC